MSSQSQQAVCARLPSSVLLAVFFFFFVLGSPLPMNRKLLGDSAALLGGLQSPVKWYNKKKGIKEERKEQNI